jgi:hypothetical protein
MLEIDPLAQSTEVVAKMGCAGWLDSGEDDAGGGGFGRVGVSTR